MTLLALTWPVAALSSVAIAAVTVLMAIVLWQTFAVVVRDDRQSERERRLREAQR